MRLLFQLGLCIGVCLCSVASYAQENNITIGSIERFNSTALSEERTSYVHLPQGYASSQKRYPVLFVLDGEWNFQKTVGIVEHLSNSDRIPEMIVVGIPNVFRSGRPSRIQDLAPASEGGKSGAHQFLQFITDELVPHIETEYRTEPHRTLLGHSMGGLFSVFALIEQPELFSAIIAISPSLGRNSQQQIKRLSALFAAHPSLKKSLQVVLANEGGNTQLSTEKFIDVLKVSAPETIDWQFRHMADEDHVSVFHPGTYKSLEAIFYGWQIEESDLTDYDISIAERHYQALSEKLGYHVPVPEKYYYQLGYRILAEHEFDYAEWTFGQYVEAYPQSSEALVGLGDIKLMQGDLDGAKSFYEKALGLSPSNQRAVHMASVLKASSDQ